MKAVKAKKHLGQHFLNDLTIANQITDLLKIQKKINVLEIGPGMGVLTSFLIEKKINLSLVEVDYESIIYLKKKFPENKKNIIHADFLNINMNHFFKKRFSIIGNFPYNISSQILFKVYENKNKVNEVVGMFQKEVAERIASKSGKKRGILSVLIQAYYEVEYCFTVDEISFSPPPKIKSAVIKLSRNKRAKLDCNEKLFKHIIKSAYNQRRKTLRNALKSFNLKMSSDIIPLLKLRAENLSVEDFIKITKDVE
ncbi:MAG: 16S rRNA (adenine(1518)-N(6)/adenine(1519)-N(6))-dimethyltransferase RsmA [Flavobacteriales bacterium]|jgi:16S rRNA (adenine1518-N6/adenine1519-N6)-dimethyltransferase|nr:16S rRNA (adenine(1518)-N(6)/adenine(1519)-N(6))-dimethyltransferase RsmA [Flavobacteriales bacterium]